MTVGNYAQMYVQCNEQNKCNENDYDITSAVLHISVTSKIPQMTLIIMRSVLWVFANNKSTSTSAQYDQNLHLSI